MPFFGGIAFVSDGGSSKSQSVTESSFPAWRAHVPLGMAVATREGPGDSLVLMHPR
jgi:hypothetical protein